MTDERVITGVAYPYLIPGKNTTNQIEANIYDKEAYYYDEAVRLSEHDVQGMGNLVGHPLCVEHDEKLDVGTITHSWTDKKGQLRFMARLNLKTKAGRIASQAIDNGELKGVSVGYSPQIDFDTMQVTGKRFNEISLCRRGFFPGAHVSVAASNNVDEKIDTDKYNSIKSRNPIIYYKITAMAEEKTAVPPTTDAAAADAVQKSAQRDSTDAAELARQTDEILKTNEKLKAELAAIQEQKEQDAARLQMLEQKEAERAQKYEAEQAEKLQSILEINRQQYKDVYGEDAVLPQSYEQSATMAFKMEEAAPQMQAITASAMAYKKGKEREAELQKTNADLLKRLEEMEGKIQKLSDVNQVAMTHVAASRRRVFNTETEKGKEEEEKVEPTLQIKASGMDMLFVPNPSSEEVQLYQRNYGDLPAPSTNVTASGADTRQKMQAPPVHAHMDQVPNSMRFKHPHIFNLMTGYDPKRMPQAKIVVNTYERL